MCPESLTLGKEKCDTARKFSFADCNVVGD